jgi:hypothetical protein
MQRGSHREVTHLPRRGVVGYDSLRRQGAPDERASREAPVETCLSLGPFVRRDEPRY